MRGGTCTTDCPAPYVWGCDVWGGFRTFLCPFAGGAAAALTTAAPTAATALMTAGAIHSQMLICGGVGAGCCAFSVLALGKQGPGLVHRAVERGGCGVCFGCCTQTAELPSCCACTDFNCVRNCGTNLPCGWCRHNGTVFEAFLEKRMMAMPEQFVVLKQESGRHDALEDASDPTGSMAVAPKAMHMRPNRIQTVDVKGLRLSQATRQRLFDEIPRIGLADAHKSTTVSLADGLPFMVVMWAGVMQWVLLALGKSAPMLQQLLNNWSPGAGDVFSEQFAATAEQLGETVGTTEGVFSILALLFNMVRWMGKLYKCVSYPLTCVGKQACPRLCSDDASCTDCLPCKFSASSSHNGPVTLEQLEKQVGLFSQECFEVTLFSQDSSCWWGLPGLLCTRSYGCDTKRDQPLTLFFSAVTSYLHSFIGGGRQHRSDGKRFSQPGGKGELQGLYRAGTPSREALGGAGGRYPG